jgi:hypothetical protein
MNNKETEVEKKNNQMKKSIIDFQKTFAQLENQNIKFNQNNYNIQSDEEFHLLENKIIINKEIEEKINAIKRIFEQTKIKWKKILNDIFALEKEIENIKNQMKNDFEKIKKEYQEELKKNLQKIYDDKMKQELQKINDCFNKKIEETIKKMGERGKNQFEKFYNNNKVNEKLYNNNKYNEKFNNNNKDNEKFNNNNKVNEVEKKENYSFKCLNSDELYAKIKEGDNKAKIIITLKNNGILPWKEGDTILCFNRESKRSGDEINLNPQKPGEVNSYDIIFKSLQSSKPGEYPVVLEFWIGDDNIGEQINAKIIIEEKK